MGSLQYARQDRIEKFLNMVANVLGKGGVLDDLCNESDTLTFEEMETAIYELRQMNENA